MTSEVSTWFANRQVQAGGREQEKIQQIAELRHHAGGQGGGVFGDHCVGTVSSQVTRRLLMA